MKVVKRKRTKFPKKTILQNERLEKWERLKKLINQPLYIDGFIYSMLGVIHIDLIQLEKHIPNYDGVKCEYKGKPNYSILMAIKEEWGREAKHLIKDLI